MEYYKCSDCTEVFEDDALGSDVIFCPSCGGRLEGLEGVFYQKAEVVPVDSEPEATLESSSKLTRFKSKEEYFQWKEERLKSTQSSKNFICPHCEESISANVTVCPFCAEPIGGKIVEPIQPQTSSDSITESTVSTEGIKPIQPSSPGCDERLKNKMSRLNDLLADKLITQKEYDDKKQQLLNEYLDV